MAVVGDSRKGETPIDLAKARERRQQLASPRRESSTNGAHASASSASTTPGDRLGGFRFSDDVAEEILQQHTELPVGLDELAEMDEIRAALEHTQRPRPAASNATPRGSADLAPEQLQRKRTRGQKMTPNRRGPSRRRGLALAGAGVLALATAGIATLSLHAARTRIPGGRSASAAASGAPATLAGINSATFNTIAHLGRERHTTVPRAHKHKPRRAARRSSTAQTNAVASPNARGHASASTSNSSPYTPPASSSQTPQQPSGGSQANTQPTGPTGPIVVVGGNCNPKCS